MPKAVGTRGFAAGNASISIGFDRVFFVEADGQCWRATYRPRAGSVSARRADGPKKFSTRRFLTQIKPVRLAGAVVLASSVLVAALLAAGMHQLLGGP